MEEKLSQDLKDMLDLIDVAMYDDKGWLRPLADILEDVEAIEEDKE